jgi:hypothetical protein
MREKPEKPDNPRTMMADAETVNQLNSPKRQYLLENINKPPGIDLWTLENIPHIVVYGAQRSRSAVLEALARLSIPPITKFPTEMILVCVYNEHPELQIFWESDDENAPWNMDTDENDLQDDFTQAVDKHVQHLSSVEPDREFWRESIEVHAYGPEQPHLTFVDFLGLMSTDGEKAKGEGRRPELLKRYMS